MIVTNILIEIKLMGDKKEPIKVMEFDIATPIDIQKATELFNGSH
jgi:hypothetical protein